MPLMPRSPFAAGLLLAFPLLLPAGTDSPLDANQSVNFAAPGARSRAMGGAFIALSDDATAATVNPAGLTQIAKPELMLQFADGTSGLDVHNFKGSYIERTGDGIPGGHDIYNNDLSGSRQETSQGSLSYASYALPLPKGVLAFSYSRPVDYRVDANTYGQFYESQFWTSGGVPPVPQCSIMNPYSVCYDDVFDSPQSYGGRFTVERLAASYALPLGTKWSLGLTAGWNKTRIAFQDRFYSTNDRSLPSAQFAHLDETADESALSWDFGVLWRPNGKFQAGFSYHRGFSYRTRNELSPDNGSRALSAERLDTDNRAPDHYGLGALWRPNPVFIIALDLDRVRYSQLKGDVKTFNQYNFDLADPAVMPEGARAFPQAFEVKDGFEPHLGAEYVAIVGGAPAVFRAGLWREAPHGLKYRDGAVYFVDPYAQPIPGRQAEQADAHNRFANFVMRQRFPGTDAQMHYSAGVGFVLRQKLQLDMGYDFAPLSKQFIMSAIYRFGHN